MLEHDREERSGRTTPLWYPREVDARCFPTEKLGDRNTEGDGF